MTGAFGSTVVGVPSNVKIKGSSEVVVLNVAATRGADVVAIKSEGVSDGAVSSGKAASIVVAAL